jgi:hypothetical protein
VGWQLQAVPCSGGNSEVVQQILLAAGGAEGEAVPEAAAGSGGGPRFIWGRLDARPASASVITVAAGAGTPADVTVEAEVTAEAGPADLLDGQLRALQAGLPSHTLLVVVTQPDLTELSALRAQVAATVTAPSSSSTALGETDAAKYERLLRNKQLMDDVQAALRSAQRGMTFLAMK